MKTFVDVFVSLRTKTFTNVFPFPYKGKAAVRSVFSYWGFATHSFSSVKYLGANNLLPKIFYLHMVYSLSKDIAHGRHMAVAHSIPYVMCGSKVLIKIKIDFYTWLRTTNRTPSESAFLGICRDANTFVFGVYLWACAPWNPQVPGPFSTSPVSRKSGTGLLDKFCR